MNVVTRFRPTGVQIVDQILDGSAPAAARSAAARGALPVSRDLLLAVFVHLTEDPDPSIRGDALASLDAIPGPDLAAILGGATTDPAILAHFSRNPSIPKESLAALVANPALDTESIVAIASSDTSVAIDMLLLNQDRLVKTPEAVDALITNGKLNTDQRRRLLDFVDHLRPETAPAPRISEPLPPELLGPVSEEELRSLLGQMSDLPFIDLEVGEFLTGESVIDGLEDLAELGESFESVYKQILKMNPPQRLRAAMRGGREARQILVRDTNRIVASAVLRNPRITEDEICSFAGQKSLSEDVLRQIGSSRAWMGSYSVMLNLIRNPKAPLATAMNHLPRLTTRDLVQVSKDRNVSDSIRRFARKHADQRAVKTKPRKH